MLHKDGVITNLSKRYLNLERSDEEIFLIEFLFNLTIAYRTVFSSKDEDSADIQFGLKHINELNHRLLNRSQEIRLWHPIVKISPNPTSIIFSHFK